MSSDSKTCLLFNLEYRKENKEKKERTNRYMGFFSSEMLALEHHWAKGGLLLIEYRAITKILIYRPILPDRAI